MKDRPLRSLGTRQGVASMSEDGPPSARSTYGRVVLKISGEGFVRPANAASPWTRWSHIAGRPTRRRSTGVQIAIVIGGGNILRGAQFTCRQLEHPRGHGPLHGHAGHGDQRPGPAGRAGVAGLRHAADDGDPHGRRGRAVHPPPGPPAPGKGADRDPGRRHRQPVRHDRHGRRPAGAGTRGRHPAEGHPRRRRLQRRPREESRTPCSTAS